MSLNNVVNTVQYKNYTITRIILFWIHCAEVQALLAKEIKLQY
jgi:hypothetical protein